MKSQIIYETEQALRQTLIITLELKNETGMIPGEIKIDDARFIFNEKDARKVIANQMTEAQYMERNEIA